MGRDAKRNTVNYTQRRGHKVVNKVKTDNPEKRAKEHGQQGKGFAIMTNSFEVCRNPASKKEKSGIDIEK